MSNRGWPGLGLGGARRDLTSGTRRGFELARAWRPLRPPWEGHLTRTTSARAVSITTNRHAPRGVGGVRRKCPYRAHFVVHPFAGTGETIIRATHAGDPPARWPAVNARLDP